MKTKISQLPGWPPETNQSIVCDAILTEVAPVQGTCVTFTIKLGVESHTFTFNVSCDLPHNNTRIAKNLSVALQENKGKTIQQFSMLEIDD